jgi:ATP-dependent Clp protease ATP-binding subunit ClpC
MPIRPTATALEDPPDDDGPRRVMDLHIVGKSDEEAAAERVRDLLAAEKTVLFSMLEPELLRTELKKVVIRQEGAIDSLCDEICLYATGTQDPKKPASYFLVGPTGVGKNYLVESLLRLFEQLWGIEVPYLELEGPEFTYPSDINELKGAARGFIRSDEEGVMTKFHERSHDKPFAVILIDEIEKAHPQLRRFFLPIMDRGTMMDNRGRMLNFVNTTIFFTSNIGYSEASRSSSHIGFGDEASESRAETAFVESRIKKTLSPEFINRVHMIHFQHLTREAVDDIFDLEMAKIRKRYRQAQGLDLRVSAAARAEFLARGYSHEYGARNLAKMLNRWANIEISKVIKRDEDRSDSDATPTLELIRAMRDGKRPLDMEHVRRVVQEATRMRLPYRSVTIDVEGGEFTYQRG